MNTDNKKELVSQLKNLLLKGNAHATFEDAIKEIPPEMRGARPANLPYSLWQILEHMRISQWDILDFSCNPEYKPMKWPENYWPKESAPKNTDAWDDAVKQFRKDTKDFIALLENKDADLYAPFPWGEGQNLLREALLIADHNSYHTGELIVIRRSLGIWKS